jgi:hypothetical protein
MILSRHSVKSEISGVGTWNPQFIWDRKLKQMESCIKENPQTSHYIFCAAANRPTDSRQLAHSSLPHPLPAPCQWHYSRISPGEQTGARKHRPRLLYLCFYLFVLNSLPPTSQTWQTLPSLFDYCSFTRCPCLVSRSPTLLWNIISQI